MSTDEDIADLATFVADEYCPVDRVEPLVIIRAKGLSHSFGQYGPAFDGMLEAKGDRFHIYCNLDRVQAPGSPRARFTLGHELGHYFIDTHRTALLGGVEPYPSRAEYESHEPIEQQADLFASNLLLPTPRFVSRARSIKPGLGGILDLANHFGTSITATSIRYVQLEILPCAVIKWDPEGFGWKWLSSEIFRTGYRKTIETRDALPRDCATGRVFAGEAVDGEILRCGTTASLWFPYLNHRSARNMIMHEEAMSLGQFGALTFLYPEDASLRDTRGHGA